MRFPIVEIAAHDCSGLSACAETTAQQSNDVTLLMVEIGVILVFYAAQLQILVYNTYAFLLRQKRFKVFHLSFFYALSSIIVVLRILFFVMILNFVAHHLSYSTNMDVPTYIDIIDNFAIFFELALGIQQLFSIVELNLMLQYSWLFKTHYIYTAQRKQQLILKKLKCYRYFAMVIIALELFVCCLLTLVWHSELSNPKAYFFITVSSIFFAIVTVLLICQLWRLFRTARKGFGGEFQQELNQLKWHLATFVVTFTLRAIALWMGFFKHWPVFPKSFPKGKMDAPSSTVFVVQFVFWNLIPIGYLTLIHFTNFRIDNNTAPRTLTIGNTGSAVHFDETTSVDVQTSPKSSIIQKESAISNSILTQQAERPSTKYQDITVHTYRDDPRHLGGTRKHSISEKVQERDLPNLHSDNKLLFEYKSED